MPKIDPGTLAQEQQWDRELLKILRMRSVEVVDLRAAEDTQSAKSRYDLAAGDVSERVDAAAVTRLQAGLDALDRRRDWLRHIQVRERGVEQFAAKLAADAPIPEGVVTARAKLAEARTAYDQHRDDEIQMLLDACDEALSPADLRVTLPKPPATRTLDAAAVATALARPDLAVHLAWHDTWGNFDLDRALQEPISEADGKVLFNLLQSLVAANEDDATWDRYQQSAQQSIGNSAHERLGRRLRSADAQRGAFAQKQFNRLKTDDKFNAAHDEARRIIDEALAAFEQNDDDQASALLAQFWQSAFMRDPARPVSDEALLDVRLRIEAADTLRGEYAQQNFNDLKVDNFAAHDAARDLLDAAREAAEQGDLGLAESRLAEYEQTAFARETQVDAPAPTIYKELILGAGASAAYYLTQNESKLDLANVLMIGKVQPWAGERGKDGNINHPHNMIDPQHSANEIRGEDHLAKRVEFSKRVAQVVGRVPNVEAYIGKVIKCPGDYFEVQTNKGSFFGKKITNALGIGNHSVPPNEVTGAAEQKFQDMDSFKRNLDGEESSIRTAYPGVKNVAIIGPNAAIDVATTIIRENRNIDDEDDKVKIHWFVGVDKKPFFLDGTDNELVADVYPALKKETGTAVSENGIITTYKWDFLRASGSDTITIHYGHRANPRVKDSVEEEITPPVVVDLAVYAIGPDNSAMRRMFKDETKHETDVQPLGLEPVYDIDQHFNLRIEEQDPVKLMQAVGLSEPSDTELCAWLKDPDLTGANKLFRDLPPVVGVQGSGAEGDQSSIEFIGASAMRMAQEDSLTYDYVGQLLADQLTRAPAEHADGLRELQRKLSAFDAMVKDRSIDSAQKLDMTRGYVASLAVPADNDPLSMATAMLREYCGRHIKFDRKKQAEVFNSYGGRVLDGPMQTVTNSLPDNVVVNDQLTSSRAQIEARYQEMPTDPDSVPLVAHRGGINLITSDQTVIAAHIASCYPSIPQAVANYITGQIVNSRTSWRSKEGLRPLPARQEAIDEDAGEQIHDLRQQEAFQVEWNNRLGKFAERFAQAS